MPAATRAEIAKWIEQAQEEGASYLIVVCDTFDWGDYPVTVMPDQEFWVEYDRLNGKNMQRIMEVYDLNHDIGAQMRERRTWHLPAKGRRDGRPGG